MLMTDQYALIGGEYGQLQLIEPDTALTLRAMYRHSKDITCIVYCRELSMVITGSRDTRARVWNVTTDNCVHMLNGHTQAVSCAAVHGTTYVNCTLLMVV
jgi:WD40 repeat protein